MLVSDDLANDDKNDTIFQINEAQKKAISIIFVGIGDKFKAGTRDHFLKYLDHDNDNDAFISKIEAKEEKKKKLKLNHFRDVVQFLSFQQLKEEPEELILQALDEFPKQIIEY